MRLKKSANLFKVQLLPTDELGKVLPELVSTAKQQLSAIASSSRSMVGIYGALLAKSCFNCNSYTETIPEACLNMSFTARFLIQSRIWIWSNWC